MQGCKGTLAETAAELDGGLQGSLQYNADLFDPTTAHRLAEELELLIEAAVADPRRRVRDLPSMRAPARFQLLREWNASAEASPPRSTIHRAIDHASAACRWS